MNRWLAALLGISMPFQFVPEAVAVDSSGRPALAEDIETRFDGRFLVTTNGQGTHVVYQKVDGPTPALEGRELVCMMEACYADLGTIPSAVLESASQNKEHAERIKQRFKADRDAYDSVLKASVSSRAAAEQVWRNEMVKIGGCIRDKEAC
jgi:hypothetical protein